VPHSLEILKDLFSGESPPEIDSLRLIFQAKVWLLPQKRKNKGDVKAELPTWTKSLAVSGGDSPGKGQFS
jgi:hypothetical protein